MYTLVLLYLTAINMHLSVWKKLHLSIFVIIHLNAPLKHAKVHIFFTRNWVVFLFISGQRKWLLIPAMDHA